MRRTHAVALLVGVAALAVTVVAAAGVGPFQPPPDVRVTNDTDGATVLDPFRYRNESSPRTVVHVGDERDGPPRPIAVLVLQNGPKRGISLTVSHDRTNATLYERTVALPENGTAVIVFNRPADYTLTVSAVGETSVYRIERDQFDCNKQTYGVAVEAGGQTLLTRVGTQMAC